MALATATPVYLRLGRSRIDVSAYAAAHPGGRDVLEALALSGEDAMAAFLDVGHSKAAQRKVEKLARETEPETDPPEFAEAVAREGPVAKLFTKEDPLHLHKTLGLCHFLYFYALRPCFSFSDRLQSPAVVATIAVALSCLSLSSLIFHVPRRAARAAPGIHAMFRAHSVLFALRGTACTCLTLLGWFRCRVAVAILVGILADLVTEHLSAKDDNDWRTTRTMPYWEGCGRWRQRAHKLYYTWCQFGATALCMQPFDKALRPMDTLVAIQGAAFLQTLVRKGLLNSWTYHVLYTLQLSYVILAYNCDRWLSMAWGQGPVNSARWCGVLPVVCLATFLRLVLGVNKHAVLVAMGVWALAHSIHG